MSCNVKGEAWPWEKGLGLKNLIKPKLLSDPLSDPKAWDDYTEETAEYVSKQ